MDKNTFLKSVTNMKSYDKRIQTIEGALGVQLCESLINDMLDDICDLLIISINPNLEGLNEDYFYETFWQYLFENATDEDWAEYFDALVEGAAPSEYIERYS